MNINKPTRPTKILQFGQGNFLRGFCDTLIDAANEAGVYNGGIVVVQSVGQTNPAYAAQNNCYTTLLRGKENGDVINTPHIITSLQDIVHADNAEAFLSYAACPTLEAVLSNTTEAGIVYDGTDDLTAGIPRTFPGKLTRFLHERYCAFHGDPTRGLVIFPTELIEHNGRVLRDYVLRHAHRMADGDVFAAWIDGSCLFCDTLVDRIVTGYPKNPEDAERIFAQLGYTDALLTVAEPFGLWVIEARDTARAEAVLPLDRAGLPVVFTDDLTPYRERKVRILNGAHTSFVPAAFLAGEDIVRDCMFHHVIRPFIDTCIYHEILPTLEGRLDTDDLRAFANAVCERFENPFIDHALISICLNSVSKWRARVLPSVLDSVKSGILPHCLIFSFAALCHFYAAGRMTDDGFVGTRAVDGRDPRYTVSDSAEVLAFFAEHGHADNVLARFAACTEFWGMDLTSIPGFAEAAQMYFDAIADRGVLPAMRDAIHTSRRV